MPIHDEVRQALAGGLYEDSLLDVTSLIAKAQADGPLARPIVLQAILTVLEGTWKRWFRDGPTDVSLAQSLNKRIIPAVEAVLLADERGHANELLVALDALVDAYAGCVKAFPV